MNSQRIIAVFRWALSFSILAGIVLVYHRWLHVSQTTVALTLLLFILVLASRWSLRLSIVLSIAATFCYNFFFLPPIGTLTIADPQNWLALLAFLCTAVIGSRLSQKARNEAEDARSRQRELETLFRLSRELLQTENVAELVGMVPRVVVGVTLARSSALFLLEPERIYQAGQERVSEVEFPHFRQQAVNLASAQCREDEIFIPVRAGVKPRGLLLLRGASLSMETADAIGGLVSIAIDRAQALEDVAHSEANKESERLRTLMIDSITHELRTPLTSIKGAATTLLGAEAIDNEGRKELLTIIDEETDRIDRLVGEAVEMAQLDANSVKMQFGSVSVPELVRLSLESCSGVEHTHELQINIPELPQVRADVEFIQKVLCNLIENAAKYSSPGSLIAISAEQAGSDIAISVADRGVGIDPSEQTLIFDRFYRAPIHSERIPGTGMGLSISKAIVERHDGKLTLVSKPGEGSVFTITLPISRASRPHGMELQEH
jgi:two-component system, OmpR family, sensor histidine kinase KdpD